MKKAKHKSMRQFNKLTPTQHEAIALLLEEAGEVVQICGKILRHGLRSRHPDSYVLNRDELGKECGDFAAALAIAIDTGVVSEDVVKQQQPRKLENVQRWLHHIKVKL